MPGLDKQLNLPNAQVPRHSCRRRPVLGVPPIVQYAQREGEIELAWGHPDPVMLPVADIKYATARMLDRYGTSSLSYGHPPGPGPLAKFVCDRLAVVDGRPPKLDEVVISAGNSQAIDLVVSLFTSVGDVLLTESPTYHFAFRIFRDHGLELEPVPVDEEGLRVDALAATLVRLRKAGRVARLLYTVPTYHNPTGITFSDERRRSLVELAAAERLTIIEDDPYRELAYDGPPSDSLWSIAPPGTVIRLGTFSKSLAPGLRVGFVTADAPTAERIGLSGVLDSGGAISHFAALVVAEYATSGAFEPNVERLRTALRERRTAMLEALDEHLAGFAGWRVPAGGYFLWLTLPNGMSAQRLLPIAERHGTTYVPGSVFHVDPSRGDSALRLAFSRHSPDELREAVRRLGLAAREASAGGRTI